MQPGKEQWISKTMNSLDGIQPAVMPVNMHSNILQRIQDERRRIIADAVQASTIYRAAAAILLIITMNVFTCVVVSKKTMREKQIQTLTREFSISDSGDSLFNN